MITPKKFACLPPETQKRKLVRLLMAAELEVRGQPAHHWNPREWPGLLAGLSTLESLQPWASSLQNLAKDPWNLRTLNSLRHSLQAHLHTEAAEWDLLPPLEGDGVSALDKDSTTPTSSSSSKNLTDPQISIYLDGIRSPFNVGSIFRTAWAFGCETILLAPEVPRPDHQRVIRTSMGATAYLPWEVVEQTNLLAWCRDHNYVPRALETGGPRLDQVQLPHRWMVILGSEELGVSPRLLDLVERVTIPLPGRKASLNVGVSLGIGLAHWQLTGPGATGLGV